MREPTIKKSMQLSCTLCHWLLWSNCALP